MKRILTLFFGETEEFSSLQTALHVASELRAYLQCLHISVDDPNLYAEVGMTASVMDAIESTIKTANIQKEKSAREIYHEKFTHFIKETKNANLVFDHNSSWVHLTGHPNEIISKEGRVCDLIILSRHLFEKKSHATASSQAAIFETGCPVLVVPVNERPHKKFTGERVAIAWDGSIQSSRAVHRSLPLLKKAKDIVILTVNEKNFTGPSAESLIVYLTQHGIQAYHKAVDKSDYSVGEALMIETLAQDASTLVMGAYSHNRYRQMIFGGVTDFILQHAKIPVLMVH